jgi:hypothetical protein
VGVPPIDPGAGREAVRPATPRTDAVVVALRWSAAARALDLASLRACALVQREELRSARLAAWGPLQVAFAFAPTPVEPWAALAVGALDDLDVTVEAVGIARGRIEFAEGPPSSVLAWGPAVLAASERARSAPGASLRADRGVLALAGGAQLGELRWIDLADEGLVEAARLDGPIGRRVGRVAAVLSVRRGDEGEGLRALRRGVAVATSAEGRAREGLAYAAGLAAAGRSEAALLEALSALAATREAGDPRGERACVAFLARLAAATGHLDAAQRWRARAALLAR